MAHPEGGMRTYNAARGDESSLKIVTRHFRQTTNKIDSKRRSVQSQAKNLFFPLDESLSPSVVNLTFLRYRPRDT